MSIKAISFTSQTNAPKAIKQNRTADTSFTANKDIDKFEKKKSSTAKTIGIATAAIATLATITAIIITKGKAAKKAKLLNQIPKELQAKFEKLKNLEGETFTNKAYDELVDFMGLKGIAPKKIILENKPSTLNAIEGGYNPTENIIVFTKSIIKAPKGEQISLLSHELTHCKQHTNILRTEGITVEMYAKNTVESWINMSKKDDLGFKIKLRRAEQEGKKAEFLKNTRENWTKEIETLIHKNLEGILKMPKIKADSPEGIKALNDLKSIQSYEGLGMLGIGSKEYISHPLEIEAYGYGGKMKDLFNKFTQAMNV